MRTFISIFWRELGYARPQGMSLDVDTAEMAIPKARDAVRDIRKSYAGVYGLRVRIITFAK